MKTFFVSFVKNNPTDYPGKFYNTCIKTGTEQFVTPEQFIIFLEEECQKEVPYAKVLFYNEIKI